MPTSQANGVAERFLEALSQRDFEGIGAAFAEDGRLRGLVPAAVRELHGREAIAERFSIWNDGDDWELVEAELEDFADVVKLRWRVAATEPEGRVVFEQVAYAEIGEDGITWMNLVCSGQRRAS